MPSASVILAALTVAFAVAACDSSSGSPGGSGGSTAGNAGGPAGSGGSGGAGPGGGSGGANSGAGGANAGAGGTNAGGSGGANAGAGGADMGGSGGVTGGAGGAPMGGSGGAADGGIPPAAFLDDCFAGLRMLASRSQTSDRNSSDGAYRIRLAIEVPPDRFGTSGTRPWEAVRIGIVTPQKQVCIKDEAALADAYKGSHHNCADVLVVMSDGLVFEIKPPDVSPDRSVTTLTIMGEAAVPAVMLPNVTCTGTNGAECRSGGPCT